MMKKFTALLLALALLCGLAGCGRQQAVRQPGNDDASSAARPEPPRAPGVSDLPDETPDESETPDGALQPEDYLGSWNGNVYSNKALNLCFTLPEGWVYASDEELPKLTDIAAGSDEDAGRTKNHPYHILFAYDPVKGTNVQITYVDLSSLDDVEITEEEHAEILIEQQKRAFSEEPGDTAEIGETYRATLGSEEFLVIPANVTRSGVDIKSWTYLRLLKDRLTIIIISGPTGEDVETMVGGASAFAPLGAGGAGGSGSGGAGSGGAGSGGSDAGSSGTSGAPTAVGDIGRKFSTMFFDYTVIAAESPDQYSGYAPANGNRLVVVRVRVKNDFGSDLTMYDTDFQLQWSAGDDDYAWAVDAFNDKMMPLEWELADGQEATYDMLFEAPAGQNDFSLVYLEEYIDRNGKEQTGDLFSANFTLLSPAAA